MAAPSLPPSGYWQRIVYILMPLLLLLLFLGLINLWPATETAVSPPTPAPPPTLTTPPTPTTVATAETAVSPPPTATSQPVSTLPPGDITLLGPPAGSTFPVNTPITLFWQWPHPLTEGQQFNVYWQQDGQTRLLGQLDEPNFGNLYQFQTTPTTAGNTVWWVTLEISTIKSAQVESLQRSLSILP
ncbi:MAG: hypothetical protein R3C62_12735 [Chloroflexota bacterium]